VQHASKTLLVVAHAPSPNTRRLLQAVLEGARHPELQSIEPRHVAPLDATPDDVLGADGLLLGTTENLGYMAGATKDFFDRVFYPCEERTRGLPYALYIRGRHDGTGTRRAVESIVSGMGWKRVQEPRLFIGDFEDAFLDACRELGGAMAAGLEMGIFGTYAGRPRP
jgi:hypothetical protein